MKFFLTPTALRFIYACYKQVTQVLSLYNESKTELWTQKINLIIRLRNIGVNTKY